MMKAIMIAVLTLLVSSQAMATVQKFSGTNGDDSIYIGMYRQYNPFLSIWENRGLYKYVNGTLTALTPLTSGSNEITVSGLAGDDFIEVINSTDGLLTISLTQQLRKFTPPAGQTLHYRLLGNADADTIHGSDFDDILEGGPGNDSLSGRAGDDVIDGGDENSAFCSMTGDGIDACYGDAGDDTVACGALVNGGADTDACQDGGSIFGSTNCEADACP